MALGWMLLAGTALVVFGEGQSAPYFGSEVGSFKTFAHDVVGRVYAVDDRTIYIKGFSYDGQGPDAYFWGGSSAKPDTSGFIIPNEKGKKVPLQEYRHKDLLLRLPPGKTLRNIKWISVWCRKFNANFGEVKIPSNLVIPRPMEIGRIPTLEHGVSSGPVLVVDTQTLLVPDFTYDGLGPAAYWWVSRGSRQHPRGLRLADENGSFSPLPRYTGKTVVITLPPEHTIYDFDWFGVWCEEARVDFGSVKLPADLVVPPSPRTLGIELEYKLNCEVLRDDLGYEVRWIMDGEDIVLQLVARIDANEYMSFGLSKNDTKSEMVNSDAIVAWMDKKGKGHAQDYFLGSKDLCVGRKGSCPDVKHPDGRDSVTLLNAATVNGYTMITVKRPQVGMDQKYDQHVYSDGPQAVVWAVGPQNDGDVKRCVIKNEEDVFIDFARSPQWNCPQPADSEPQPEYAPPPPTTTTTTTQAPTRRPTKRKQTTPFQKRKPQPIGPRYASRAHDVRSSESKVEATWDIPPVMCPSDKTLRAQIGPSGGKEGFQAITGIVGWGIAWYINGVLIPEITLERGQTYTFVVEGGNDPENPARTHPFYITDDPEGGYAQKTGAEKKKVKIYAGATADRRGRYLPTGRGRLCEWKLPQDMQSADFETFEDFQQNLELKCERGKSGRFIFKPDRNTPDLLYYQCYTHRHLGWKIHVVDSCDGLSHEASIQHVKNITYNSLASDFKRGGEKMKLFAEERPHYPRNDGIPLVLDDSSHAPDIQKESHHTPQSYPTTPAAKSEMYFKLSRVPQEKKTYFVTTPHPKAVFKYSTPRPPKVVTMETFQLGDVVPAFRQRGNYFSQKTTVDHPPRGYPNPQQQQPQMSDIKNTLQWWNSPSNNQAGPGPTVSTLRQQLAVLQGGRPTQETAAPQRHQSQRPPSQRPQGHQNKVISVVVNNDPGRYHSQGSSPGRTYTIVNTEQKKLVPLIVMSPKQHNNHRGDRPKHSQRTKGGSEFMSAPSRQVVRHAHPSNSSVNFDRRKVPMVPVVLEKNANNVYSLHQVLSLLNHGGVVHSRGIRSAADHHPGHHGNGHHEHEHDHGHDHKMDQKDSSEKSLAISTPVSLGMLWAVCILHAFLRRV